MSFDALIITGPKKLPDMAQSFGRAINEFKKASREFKDFMDPDHEVTELKRPSNDLKNSFHTRAGTPTRKPDTPNTIVDTAPSQTEGKDTIDPTDTNQSKTDA